MDMEDFEELENKFQEDIEELNEKHNDEMEELKADYEALLEEFDNFKESVYNTYSKGDSQLDRLREDFNKKWKS